MIGGAGLAVAGGRVEVLGRSTGALVVDGVVDLSGFAAHLGWTSRLGAGRAHTL